MCGRFAQYRAPHRYAKELGLDLFSDSVPLERYNVAPTTGVHVMHQDGDFYRDSVVPWGWKPHWADNGRPGRHHLALEIDTKQRLLLADTDAGDRHLSARSWHSL